VTATEDKGSRKCGN